MSPATLARTLSLVVLLSMLTGCKSAYYGAWQKLGWEKRDLLADEVEEARDEQEAAKEQIKTTLERFQEVTNFQGGDLEAQYKKLNKEYERSEARATAVREKIADVEDVANDMFKEWQQELSQYQSSELRQSSEQKLNDTRTRYNELLAAMKRAEERMPPVLAVFKDQVLFLKHNLNAQAIASLQTTTAQIESDVSKLIADMEASIAEANEFMKQIQ